jgi:hypothetical protein
MVPVQLNDGVDEKALLEVSDQFHAAFVSKQRGVVKRILLRSKGGGYADLVFFESQEDAERVAAAEQSSPECLEFLKIMKPPAADLPDMGVLSFEHLRTYD